MYFYPFKDPEVADYFVQGVIKAGFPATEYYIVCEEDELTGEEIRDVVSGRTATGLDFSTGKQWWIDYTKDRKVTYRGGMWGFASGTFRIEADMLWYQWEKRLQGQEYPACIFLNPEGTPEMKNEYLSMTDFGIYPWSPAE